LTKAEARKAVRWFQKRMRITDWTIELDFQDAEPDWLHKGGLAAATWRAPKRKRAGIWLSATRAQEDNESLLVLLFHECLHIAESDVGLPNPTTDPAEHLWDRLAEICETAYLAETNGANRRRR